MRRAIPFRMEADASTPRSTVRPGKRPEGIAPQASTSPWSPSGNLGLPISPIPSHTAHGSDLANPDTCRARLVRRRNDPLSASDDDIVPASLSGHSSARAPVGRRVTGSVSLGSGSAGTAGLKLRFRDPQAGFTFRVTCSLPLVHPVRSRPVLPRSSSVVV
jgi:hypothetical protein